LAIGFEPPPIFSQTMISFGQASVKRREAIGNGEDIVLVNVTRVYVRELRGYVDVIPTSCVI
jgi:hypothetical protein